MNKEHVIAQALLRLWPFPYGTGRIVDKILNNLAFQNQFQTIKTTDGFEMTVMPNELIGRHLYLTGEFDRAIVEILCSFAEPGDVLLDVGANLGYVSACFLNKVPKSKILAVEPQPGIVDLLRANLLQFGDRQIIFPFALSDRDGEVAFSINLANRGGSKIALSDDGNSVKVPVKSSVEFFRGIDGIDLVKIDVEGHEETILQASKEHLAKLQPRAIIFEAGHRCLWDSPLQRIFSEIDYRVYGIHKRLTKLVLRPIRALDDGCWNYIAISASASIPQRARWLYGV
jgi:FkbM family methyltransferase